MSKAPVKTPVSLEARVTVTRLSFQCVSFNVLSNALFQSFKVKEEFFSFAFAVLKNLVYKIYS